MKLGLAAAGAAVAAVLIPAVPALAAPGGGCANATLNSTFGEVCTFASVSHPFSGWYAGEGARGATVRVGLEWTAGGSTTTLWDTPRYQQPDGGVVYREWTGVVLTAGACWTALAQEGDGPVARGQLACR